ncbi:MAG: hypothetical protein KTR30_38330 [Saprospiraceae bacterium]|nr:hypothetical protein [Saprospiraceae bacterium]
MKTWLLLQAIVDKYLLLIGKYQPNGSLLQVFREVDLPRMTYVKPYSFNRPATINTMSPKTCGIGRLMPCLFKRVIPLLLYCLLLPSIFYSQNIVPTKPDDLGPEFQDSTQLNVINLPMPLLPLNGINAEAPYYRFLWIFGDGNFQYMKDSTFINHRYDFPASESPKTHDVFLYKNALYGGGKPPPKRTSTQISNLHQAEFDTIPIENASAVKPNALVHLQKHMDPLLPSDTSLWILSIKNPDSLGQRSLNGQVYLFFDGVVTQSQLFQVEGKNGGKVQVPAKSLGQASPNYADFQLDTTLIYNDEILGTTFQAAGIPVSTFQAEYKRTLFWNFSNLSPGEERHIFVQFTVDSLLLDKFSPKRLGSTKLMAMMTVYNDDTGQGPGFDFGLTEEDAKRRNELGLDSVLLTANQGEQNDGWFGNALLEGGFEQPFNAATTLVDLMEVDSRLASSYDPNYMRVDACSCPPNTDGAQKMIATVHFENDGMAATRNIFINIEIPEQIQLNSVFDSLLRVYPPLDPASSGQIVMDLDEASRTLTWKLLDFQIESVAQYGAGDPSTFGEITFTLLTETGVDLDDIPEMQACIRFDEEDNDPVCTLPVKTNQLTQAEVSNTESEDILQCENCDCPPFDFWQWLLSLPWWLAVLIVLGLILLVLLIRRLRS